MKNIIYLLSVCTLFTISFSSCEKTADLSTDNLPDDVINQVKSFTSANGNLSITMDMITTAVSQSEFNGELPTCAKISPDLTNKTLKIDFGSGCIVSNAATLSGVIAISYTGKLGQAGSTAKVVFVNFSVNQNAIDGIIELRDFGKGLNGNQLEYKAILTNLKITQSGKTSTFNAELQQSFKSGLNTSDLNDNVISTTIAGNYSDNTGESFDISTQTAMLILGSCKIATYPIPVSGVVVLTPKKGAKISIDFGAGNCDSVAKITSGTVTKEINLTDK